MGVDINETRSWHLPRPAATAGSGRQEPGDGAGALGDDGSAAAATRPLWVRVLTGASLAWRARALRRRIIHWRRGLARRTVRWVNVNADVRAHLEAGRPLAALRAARGTLKAVTGSAAVTPSRARWPTVPLPVEVCGVDPAHPLARYVEPATAHAQAAAVVLVGPGCPHDAAAHTAMVVGVGVAPPHAVLVVGGGPGGAADRLPEPFDPAVHNPIGFSQHRSAGRIAIAGRKWRELHRDRAHGLHHARSVTCTVAPDEDGAAVAAAIIALAAQGVPLVAASTPEPVDAILGAPLAALLTAGSVTDLRDDRIRELHSVRLRRAAYRAHGPAARWRQIATATGMTQPTTPSLSVLLATKRPGHVLTAARQVATQRGDRPQLVVGLHGSGMPDGIAERVRAVYPGDLVVRTFDDRMDLGEVLDALARSADGDVISKWDDDDWYAADHLDDMRSALQYSGEVLVGKAAEFVYLEELDLTIRRHTAGAERASTTVAGGTLTMARADLIAMGGWPPAVRQADRRLIARVHDHGGQSYRTHGFGYVLRRAGGRSQQHTWRVGDDYFLLAASDQRPGLALGFAGFDGHGEQLAAGAAAVARAPWAGAS